MDAREPKIKLKSYNTGVGISWALNSCPIRRRDETRDYEKLQVEEGFKERELVIIGEVSSLE